MLDLQVLVTTRSPRSSLRIPLNLNVRILMGKKHGEATYRHS